MRRIVSITVFSLALLNLVGFYAFFFWGQFSAKNTMHQSLSEAKLSETEILHFTGGEFKALERPEGNDEEIRLNGNLYDIKAIERDGNDVTVYAKRDTEETNLVAKLISWLEDEGERGKSSPNQLLLSINPAVVVSTQRFVLFENIAYVNIPVFAEPICSLSIPVSTPPPDFSFSA